MKTKHTPGPFETALSVSNLALVEIKARKGKRLVRIASVEGNDSTHNAGHPIPAEEAIANARLFVSAPVMYDLLKRALADRIDDAWLKAVREELAKIEESR